MSGYYGKFLKVDMTNKSFSVEEYPEDWQDLYIGGRGFAVRYLWEHLEPGTDPLSPENILIFSIGPLSGLSLPSSSKMIVAAKSPLTGGYGDGNLGSRASPQIRKAGYDAIIFVGKADKPTYLEITNDDVKFHDASEIWGKGTYATDEYLVDKFGIRAGRLTIGQAGENLVRYATIRSQEGRSGGRPGIGAVMGSKNLKAVVIEGEIRQFPMEDREGARELGSEGYKIVKEKPNYEHWMNQGTTAVLEWCHETDTLPTRNFQEGQFTADQGPTGVGQAGVNGDKLNEIMTTRAGCPRCNMTCGLIIEDAEGHDSELDYENIGMLGPNIGIDDLRIVGVLNWMADDYGIDTISLGSVLGMAAEASQNDALGEEFNWGDWEKAKELITRLALRVDEIGDTLAQGTMRMAEAWSDKTNGESKFWAIHVKGLECSAYNAFSIPGMALSFGTSPIGAHHKDAWVISYEISETDRDSYDPLKADKVIELQRIRGGMFESLTTCRFPWIEVGYDEENYPKFMNKVTGRDDWTMEKMYTISDRIYNLMRAFWVREFNAEGKDWDRKMDYPPVRWFERELGGDSPHSGKHLEYEKYDELLNYYYSQRGWDERGIPKKETLSKSDLSDVGSKLENYVSLN